ncbi:hypothetical protein [Streptomyces sp. NPDC048248]|uniref:hypothetical protein n=1 Tax=Streptomyces sp. NPDC048248 TaxID=3365523 RepID=UPI00371A6C12
MGQGFDVESEALRRYARAVEAATGKIESIRKRNLGLTLDQGTFGKLPESDNLKADYDTQSTESADDLNSAVETLESIAEAMRDSAEAYDANEESQVQALGGGA